MVPLAWTLLSMSIWTCGAKEFLLQENVKVLYPLISSNGSVECDCLNVSCDSVFWFRSLHQTSKVEFIGKCNNAIRTSHGPGVDKTRFIFSKRGRSFMLRVNSLTKADTGTYSCVLKDNNNNEIWKPGTLLLPGVVPPTAPPTKKPPVKPVCRCYGKTHQKAAGCSSLVQWPLVGLVSGLALALICTLYYFSRLPKKCHHHFGKKRLMT